MDITLMKTGRFGVAQQAVNGDHRYNEPQWSTRSILQVQEDERRRIARELHDGLMERLALLQIDLGLLGQRLPSENVHLSARLASLASQVTALSDEVRNISHRMHPAVVEDLGLEAGMRQLVEEFEHSHKIDIHLRMSIDTVSLPVATAIYRVAQEALHNAAKHAPGALVNLTIELLDNALRLTVSDNGPGFNRLPAEWGLGLIAVAERANLAGGKLAIHSIPQKGTVVTMTIPQ